MHQLPYSCQHVLSSCQGSSPPSQSPSPLLPEQDTFCDMVESYILSGRLKNPSFRNLPSYDCEIAHASRVGHELSGPVLTFVEAKIEEVGLLEKGGTPSKGR